MTLSTSWPGSVPAIHVFRKLHGSQDVDARDKRGHDGGEVVPPLSHPINLIRPLLERRREAAKCQIEHRAHEHAEHAAFELIGDEELDLAGALALRMEGPAVFQPAEGSLQIFDENLQARPIEGHPADKALVDDFVRHGHVGDQNLDALWLLDAPAHLET